MLPNQWSLAIVIILASLKGALTVRYKWQSELINAYPASVLRSVSCPTLDIANGFVRHSRRSARFRCFKNFTLVGDSVVHCYGDEWSGNIPVCAAAGCMKLPSPKQGSIKRASRDHYATISCNPGYSVDGSTLIYCDGHYWNASYIAVAGMCKKSLMNPPTWCNFENHDQCGWSSDDPDRVTIEGPHTFGYRPYGLALTDHTGTGHMLVVWSAISGQSNQESVNRLYSPVYGTKESESCFTFWYHLGGYDKMTDPPPFKVYIKPETMQLTNVTPWMFATTSDAYGQWTAGQVYIPKVSGDWQIVLEFNVWQKVYGLDDLMFDRDVAKCATRSTMTSGISNAWTSCKERCSSSIVKSTSDLKDSSCGCEAYCTVIDNCCPDYEIYCSTNSTKDDDDFLDFAKVLSNDTSSSTLTTVLITKTTTPPPFKWFFTEYSSTPSTTNRSKIYFPNESIDWTPKVTTIVTKSMTMTKPNAKTSTISLAATSKSSPVSTPSTTKLINGIAFVIPVSPNTEYMHVVSINSTTTNQIMTLHESYQPKFNQTELVPSTKGITLTVNSTHADFHVNQSDSHFVVGESRNSGDEKAELSVQHSSSMGTIPILVCLFIIVSFVGIVVLIRRHKRYLGSSGPADSELRFLAHENN